MRPFAAPSSYFASPHAQRLPCKNSISATASPIQRYFLRMEGEFNFLVLLPEKDRGSTPE
jgi:hypothetical protein